MDNLERQSVEPEPKTAMAWTRAIRRRAADEGIRERPYEDRFWMRYFGRYPHN